MTDKTTAALQAEVDRLRKALEKIGRDELHDIEAPFDVWDRLTRIALEVLDATPCPECGGTGGVDSGGMTPWGSGITVPCPSCATPAPDVMPEINPTGDLRYDKCRADLAQCQRERDKLNDEVQVEIGFKLQAREDLERCQRDCAAMTDWLRRNDPQTYEDMTRGVALTDSGKDFIPLADVQPLVGVLMNCLCALKSNDGPFVQPARDALATFRKAHP